MTQCVAGIDIGYRNTKVLFASGGQSPKSFCFPSLALPALDSMGTGLELDKRDTVIVQVDDEVLEVGPDIELALGPHSAFVLHNDYIKTPTHMALFRGALAYIGKSKIDVLVVGLPVNHIETHAQTLIKRLQGKHPVPGVGEVVIEKVRVVPQPFGTMVDQSRHEIENADSQHRVLILDPGFFTLDWVTLQGQKHLPRYTGSFPAGVSHALDTLARCLSRELGEVVEDLAMVDRGVTRGYWTIYNKKIPLSRYLDTYHKVLEPGLQAIKRQFGSEQSIQRILLSGGGASLYKPLVAATFPRLPLVVVEDPVMSNARGFLELARHLSRQHLDIAV